MRKLLLAVLSLLLILACESGFDINATCVMKHTALVTRLQSSAATAETIAVNLSWTWVYGIPAGDGVIIERSLGNEYDSIDYVSPVESLMTYTDASDTLTADTPVSYRFTLLTGKATQCFDTVDFTLPAGQDIYYPDTEFISFDSILEIRFARLPEYDTTNLELYKLTCVLPESVYVLPLHDVLLLLTSPVWSQTTADTIFSFNANALIDTIYVYILKVSASKNPTLGYITDTSVGLLAFRRY